MILYAFIAVFVTAVVIFLLQPDKRHKKQAVTIPGPKPIPLLGNAHTIQRGYLRYLQVLDMCKEYFSNGLFRLWLANHLMIYIIRPDYVETVLRSTKHIEKSKLYSFLHVWLGTGLLTSIGDKWRRRRKMLTRTFHFNILQDFLYVFNQQANVLVDKLNRKSVNGPFDVFQDIAHCALDIICETAMGKSINAQLEDSEYVKAVYRMSYFVDCRMRKPLFWSDFLYRLFGYGNEQSEKLKILHDFTNSVISDRLKNFDQKRTEVIEKRLRGAMTDSYEVEGEITKRLAFLDMLLYMSDSLTKLSMEDIRDEVDTFMFGGHDTTAAAMSWAIHLLGSHPEAQAKLHEELDSVFGVGDREPTMEDLKSLKYLECCIKESLRLYPSAAMIARKVAEDLPLGPHILPEGSTAVIVILGIHRNPDIFPEPEAFKPERFFLENTKSRHPYAYIPFSAGSRNCIGQKFAILEEKAVLSKIFRKFNVKAMQKNSEVRPVPNIVLRPENGIVVEMTPRFPTI